MLRSPFPTPGRNTLLENIWQSITNFARTVITGQQRPRSWQWGASAEVQEDIYYRRYDLEIQEPIVRCEKRTRELVEMVENCPEVAAAVNIRNDAIWGSLDGDDIGWDIALTQNDNVTPIDKEIYDILARLRDEVIGGITLKQASERFLSWGDAFLSVGINKQKLQIDRVLFLPTFEVFRVEDMHGQLRGYQQRKIISDQLCAIDFHPLTVVHWRYRKKVLYGRSLFAESIDDWLALRDNIWDLRQSARSIGVNANLHIMPCGYDEDDRDEYKAAFEERKKLGIVTDFYLMNGADIRKLTTTNPDFKGLLDVGNFYRLRIGMKSGVPLYLLGIPWDGGKDIASQPALAFSRSVNSDRMILTEGIKQLCNIELALKGIEKERWQYRIIYPRISVNPYEGESDESNSIGINDLDNNNSSKNTDLVDKTSFMSGDDIVRGLRELAIL